MSEVLLPVHGFVLAGGKSSRMGTDKALVKFCGRPLVEIAVAKLKEFCAEVSIVGNRDDLAGFAPVVREARLEAGPGAGIEAGLGAAMLPWCLFVPVDVPLVPGKLLRRWCEEAMQLSQGGMGVSSLTAGGEPHPAFALIATDCATTVSAALDRGERRISKVFEALDESDESWVWLEAAEKFAPGGNESDVVRWFANLNTPEELRSAEAWVRACSLEGERSFAPANDTPPFRKGAKGWATRIRGWARRFR